MDLLSLWGESTFVLILAGMFYWKFLRGRVSNEQMEALEIAISNSQDSSIEGKKVVIWLLRQSRNLTRSVSVSFSGERRKFGVAVGDGVHDMKSSNGTTDLDVLFRAVGSHRLLSHHAGYYMNGNFQTAGGTTVWVARLYWDKRAIQLSPDYDEIDRIELRETFTRHWDVPGIPRKPVCGS